MGVAVTFTPTALHDLEQIVRFIAHDSPERAQKFGQTLTDKAQSLAPFPEMGCETPEIGDASEAMPCGFEGEELVIAFNPQFLIEGIESIESEELVLRLTSPLRPGLLQQAGDEDFSYLVMPIRLNV